MYNSYFQYDIIQRGKKFSANAASEYRVYFQERGRAEVVSPWHDIPLHADLDNKVGRHGRLAVQYTVCRR